MFSFLKIVILIVIEENEESLRAFKNGLFKDKILKDKGR